jgi:hypothetical protein
MNARVANEGMSNPKLIDPTPELPDDTQLDNVDLPTRIRNVLAAAGLQTVGSVVPLITRAVEG